MVAGVEYVIGEDIERRSINDRDFAIAIGIDWVVIDCFLNDPRTAGRFETQIAISLALEYRSGDQISLSQALNSRPD